ncbi:hypothetical protein WMF45_46390 [Sorangium sp. So ce448]|uniref:hypothetical protein n=1 Tax=Sorangium sp. So ce448 TaxID=3133314 RepID=UPI003F5DC86B
MRHALFVDVRRFRCAAVLAGALHATACHQPSDCLHCADPVPVDGCEVFASARATSEGSGASDDPYKHLQAAVDAAKAAKNKKVCACAGQAFIEAVTLRAGVEVHGDYTCDEQWQWKKSPDTRSTIEGPAGRVALTLTDEAGGAKVQGFVISATKAEEPGGSSIAVAVADIPAELSRIDVLAGDGMPGEDGKTVAGTGQPGVSAPPAGAQMDVCVADPVGGEPGELKCGDVDTSGGAGGRGGTLQSVYGEPGHDGKQAPDMPPHSNKGTVDRDVTLRHGQNGAPGARGDAGGGGRDATLTLDGITGGDGTPGGTGKPGQGGGGGAGGDTYNYCRASDNVSFAPGSGASGGGGGAGGCGGAGGAGGKAGGSSIGIVSLGTSLVLVDVRVTVGKGGRGGNGAAGQVGGQGGQGASGGNDHGEAPTLIAGGDGGSGGPGGPGGGGRGGYAIGVAYDAAPDSFPESTPPSAFIATGQPGLGGQGGPGSSATAGDPGAGAVCWNFRTNAGCTR